jgi:hypothetical protein
MPLVQGRGDRELEDAVAEELEALVRLPAVLRPRGVREDDLRQRGRQAFNQLPEFATGGW